MHRAPLVAAGLLSLALSVSTTAAEEIFPVEYLTGHGNVKSQKGGLVVGGDTLRFTNDGGVWYVKNVKTIFVIPLASIVSAVASTQRENYLGALWANAVRNQDYITITTDTDRGAEALVFKVDKRHAAGIAAKINVAAKKAKERE